MPETIVMSRPDIQQSPPAQTSTIAEPSSVPDTSTTPSSPVAPEPARATEAMLAERQAYEIQSLASNIIQSRDKQLEEMTPQERDAAFAADQADAAVVTLYRLNGISDKQDFTSESRPNGMLATDENNPTDKPVKVRIKGVDRILFYISSFDGENFYGLVEGETPGSRESSPPIPKAEVLRGQLLAVSEALLNSKSLTDGQKALLKMYIGLAENGEAGISGLGTQNVDNTIKEAAKGAKVLTSDHIIGFVAKNFPEANDPRRAAIEKIIKDSHVLTAEQLVEVAKAIGLNTDVAEQIKVLELTMRGTQAKLTNATSENDRKLAASELLQEQEELKILNAIKEVVGENGAEKIKEAFERAQHGENPALAERLVKAFMEGTTEGIMQALFPPKKEESPEERAKREKLIKILGKLKTGGGALALILYWFTEQATQGLISGK